MAYCPCQKMIGCWLVFFSLLIPPATVRALEPVEVAVIANRRDRDSLELARYYLHKRRIPLEHLIELDTSPEEQISRALYEREIRQPVREALARIDPKGRIRCLVVIYGVPLAIRSLPPGENPWLVRLNQRQQALVAEEEGALGQRLTAIRAEREEIEQQLAQPEKMETRAAIDSELALVLAGDYPLEGWLPNPYFLGFRAQGTLLSRDAVLMVSRLDGPDPATVRRLIDDASLVERQGLRGRAYFDARWPKPDKPDKQGLSGYALYDAALHAAARAVRKSGRMDEVVIDSRDPLFQPGEAPGAALYCGWYSLAHYVDAFTWVRGAIGYHIASGECTTLKQPGSQVWCKRMLEQGVAATIGPVNEPYVQAFPLPDMFFHSLTEGYLGLAESYLISLPYLSWQMVLIGDPLYQPFAPQ